MMFSAIQRIVGCDLTHVFYHSFTITPIPHIAPLFGCKSPEELKRDLIYLKSHYRFVSHDGIVAHRENGYRLPPKAVAVSFDDGFVECFTVARPLLLAQGIPATFFVCKSFIDNQALMFRNKVALCVSRIASATREEMSGFSTALRARFGLTAKSPADMQAWLFGLDFAKRHIIDAACECLGIDVQAFLRDRRPYMSRDQIAQLHADGFTIGAHTTDHPELGRLADWNEVRRQVRESCDVVRAITGRTRVPFAFPFNGLNLPHAALRALRDETGSIDLMYDTNNRKDSSFIVNRICCDTPQGASGEHSNLPKLLRRAHALERMRTARCRMRGLLNIASSDQITLLASTRGKGGCFWMVSQFSAASLRLAWGMWVAVVVTAHLMPRGVKHLTHSTGSLHHTLHFLAFAGIAIGASFWAGRVRGKLLVSVGVIGLCSFLEILQHYFYGNPYEFADIRDDISGALVGPLLLPATIGLARMADWCRSIRP
jgi:peptidoglycan/xylan/chitin deacetylase (PgdA/CDA1 family)